jgi:hypothetical protein
MVSGGKQVKLIEIYFQSGGNIFDIFAEFAQFFGHPCLLLDEALINRAHRALFCQSIMLKLD